MALHIFPENRLIPTDSTVMGYLDEFNYSPPFKLNREGNSGTTRIQRASLPGSVYTHEQGNVEAKLKSEGKDEVIDLLGSVKRRLGRVSPSRDRT